MLEQLYKTEKKIWEKVLLIQDRICRETWKSKDDEYRKVCAYFHNCAGFKTFHIFDPYDNILEKETNNILQNWVKDA